MVVGGDAASGKHGAVMVSYVGHGKGWLVRYSRSHVALIVLTIDDISLMVPMLLAMVMVVGRSVPRNDVVYVDVLGACMFHRV